VLRAAEIGDGAQRVGPRRLIQSRLVDLSDDVCELVLMHRTRSPKTVTKLSGGGAGHHARHDAGTQPPAFRNPTPFCRLGKNDVTQTSHALPPRPRYGRGHGIMEPRIP